MKDIDIIQEALKKLQKADYTGYFEEMDKVVPENEENIYNKLKNKFLHLGSNDEYIQSLEIFAKKIENILSKTSEVVIENQQEVNQNQLEIEDDKPTPKTETQKRDFPKVSNQTVEANIEENKIKWEYIADSIKDKRAIIILGKGITCNYFNKSNEFNYCNHIIHEANKEGDELTFFQEDGLFIFHGASKRTIRKKLISFYSRDFSVNTETFEKNEALEKIARIPFHFFINLAPDITLNKVFEKQNFQYDYLSYYPNPEQGTPAITQKPSSKSPIIYNLFGNISNANKYLCIDHTDLFTYIEALAKLEEGDINNPNIKSFLNKTKTEIIIFLGCDLTKWYSQLILHMLRIQEIVQDHKTGRINAILTPNLKPELEKMYKQEFKIEFNNYPVDKFVNTLYKHIDPRDLRTPNNV